MLLGANHDLENTIIIILSQKGSLSAEKILVALKQNKKSVTIQGVYRVLRKLQNEGVIIKEKQSYSLRIPWLLDLGMLLEKMERNYLQTSYIEKLLPKTGKQKRTWHFTNLLKMNDFWSHVLLAMAKNSSEKIMIDYSPHAWFHLTQPEQEYQYLKTSLNSLKKEYSIIGGNTFLDKWVTKYWDFKNFEYYLAQSGYWTKIDPLLYINVIDDFILKVKLDKKTTQAINKVYKEVGIENDLTAEKVLQVFRRKAKAKMTLVKDSIQAEKYFKRFEKIFGPIK